MTRGKEIFFSFQNAKKSNRVELKQVKFLINNPCRIILIKHYASSFLVSQNVMHRLNKRETLLAEGIVIRYANTSEYSEYMIKNNWPYKQSLMILK